MFSVKFLIDLFSQLNMKAQGGYEHQLARRSASFRMPQSNKTFRHASDCGPRETARRKRQVARP